MYYYLYLKKIKFKIPPTPFSLRRPNLVAELDKQDSWYLGNWGLFQPHGSFNQKVLYLNWFKENWPGKEKI